VNRLPCKEFTRAVWNKIINLYKLYKEMNNQFVPQTMVNRGSNPDVMGIKDTPQMAQPSISPEDAELERQRQARETQRQSILQSTVSAQTSNRENLKNQMYTKAVSSNSPVTQKAQVGSIKLADLADDLRTKYKLASGKDDEIVNFAISKIDNGSGMLADYLN
jgi:hypothetical protein